MVTYAVHMLPATVALHWQVFNRAAHLPALSPEARRRALELARMYENLGRAPNSMIGAGNNPKVDGVIVAQLVELNFTVPPRAEVITLTFTDRAGGPLNDDKPEKIEASTPWDVLQAAREWGRELAPGLQAWIAQARPGDEIGAFDKEGGILTRVKIELRS